ncbi:hypothetical protein C0993_002842 [Termitomyces sp. T159_Od127]|nr:hypothetical protein C0993_002842 [Termitomyces sp. T159_Od127]
MSSEPKTAEFARLLNFFERLASYNSRSHTHNDDHDADIDEIASIPLPADLAPVVDSLANLVNNRVHNIDARQHKTTGRKRSHTIATASYNHRDIDLGKPDEESVAKFPLGKKYTFTFRLMLHKLYQIDDWKRKVKEVLERSRMEYKPLSETIAAAKAKKRTEEEEEERKQDGCVHLRAGTPTSSRQPGVRPRANSALAPVKVKERRSSVIHLKSPKSPTMAIKSWLPAEEDVRVLKKRCVGRRKSLSGPLSNGGERIGGSWIYDAEVSAAEIAKRGEAPNCQQVWLGYSPRQLGSAVLGAPMPGKGKAGETRRTGTSGADVGEQKLGNALARRERASSIINITPVRILRKRPLDM